MSVFEAEVVITLPACDLHKLFLLTTHFLTLIGEDLTFLLGWIRLAVPIDVLADYDIRSLSSSHRDWDVAERTYRDLDILLIGGAAIMKDVCDVVFAEDLLTSVTFQR